jgi:LacI family transcriptional regulator, repressor for deo operon, udp, cdd, tsx, nupC, and nupG
MSIEAVAKQAGVSVATVSRAFNLPDQVAATTRERVHAIARELGYSANNSARTLRTQRSRVIGVVLPSLLNPVFAECLDGIAQAACSAGYAILPLMTQYEVAAEQQAVASLLASNVAGLVLVVSEPANSAGLAQLQARQTPYVLAYNQHPDHPCVGVDGETAVAQLVARLHSLGHTEIAMLSGHLSASDRARQRVSGYQRGMRALGLGAPRLLEVPFVETAVDEIAQFLSNANRPTAVICSNDLIAIRCLRAAWLCGLAVPEQLSVVGFDGIALGQDLAPMLSTLAQPNAEMGRLCLQMLTEALAAGQVPGPSQSITLPHGWHEGESCAAPPAHLVPARSRVSSHQLGVSS